MFRRSQASEPGSGVIRQDGLRAGEEGGGGGAEGPVELVCQVLRYLQVLQIILSHRFGGCFIQEDICSL